MGSAERKPSLEAPSLGLRRRKKAAAPSSGEQPSEPGPATVDETPPTTSSGEQPTIAMPRTVDETPPTTSSDEQPTVAMPGTADETPVPTAPTIVDPGLEEQDAEEPTLVQPAAPPAPAKRPRAARPPRGPINGHLAAAVAGIVVGVFLVAATVGGLQACESVRGTTSCGGGPGFFLLLLIVVLGVVIGAAVLRAAQVPSAGSISFLAVALVSVVSVLFLLDVLDQTGGGIAVGVVTVASYLLSHWVTVRYIDTAV